MPGHGKVRRRGRHHYIGDSQPGQTKYVGLNQAAGFWYAINGAGKVIK